jgi:branched-chain amino acid transport system permease protein
VSGEALSERAATQEQTALARPPVTAGSRWQRGIRYVVPVVLLIVAVDLPFALSAGGLQLAVNVLILAIGALGLDVLTGRTGQVSLGHAFFLAVGAIVAGKLGTDHNLNALIWIPAAGLVAGLVGGLIGPAALRLRGLYLAIVTLALVEIGRNVFPGITWLSGGPGGRAINDPHFWSLNFTNGTTFLGKQIDTAGCYYYLALLILVLGMLFVHNMGRSRVGRSMAAVRDRELAAAVIGVNLARTKVTAFILSSALAGVCGALYAGFTAGGFVNFGGANSNFDLVLSINFVVMIVVGGMGSIWGPLLGAFVVAGVPQLLQNVSGSLPFISSGQEGSGGVITAGDASSIVFGVLLIVFLLVEPRGVVGIGRRVIDVAGRRFRRPEAHPSAPGN